MKIAISANGKELASTIDERFGRCRYFIILETADMSYEAVENTHADLPTSAGIQAATFVASTGVEAVITGNCGPKASQVFAATDIKVVLGQRGVIKDVVEKFKHGAISPATRDNLHQEPRAARPPANPVLGRPGLEGDAGRGMGGGGGRGMGGGGGRGMGGGGGMGRRCQNLQRTGATSVQNRPGNPSREGELTQMQRQAEDLKRRMEAIQSEMNRLD
jgi:predicted Fe-Mo cluster-binding NifX family protein